MSQTSSPNFRLQRFHRALNAWNKRKLNYGTSDCAQFAQHVVSHMGGPHLITVEYDSKEAADSITEADGGLQATTERLVGSPVSELSELGPGDLVYWQLKGDDGLGLYESSEAIVALVESKFGNTRMRLISIEHAVCGWKVIPDDLFEGQ